MSNPTRAVMSAADMIWSKWDNSIHGGVGENSYWGDPSAAVDMKIDAVMVHNGRVYEFSYEKFQRAVADPGGPRDTRLGDLVRESNERSRMVCHHLVVCIVDWLQS
jgi:hypothetical protein